MFRKKSVDGNTSHPAAWTTTSGKEKNSRAFEGASSGFGNSIPTTRHPTVAGAKEEELEG
jgi:hypothetical protein